MSKIIAHSVTFTGEKHFSKAEAVLLSNDKENHYNKKPSTRLIYKCQAIISFLLFPFFFCELGVLADNLVSVKMLLVLLATHFQ